MADIAVQTVTGAGINPAFVAASVSGDTFTFPKGKRVELEVVNGHSAPLDVRVEEQVTTPPLGTAESDRTVSVTNAQRRKILIEDSPAWIRASDGKVELSYPGGVTNLTVGVFAY